MKFTQVLDCLRTLPISILLLFFPDAGAQILNIDLERIANWAARWLVNFNALK